MKSKFCCTSCCVRAMLYCSNRFKKILTATLPVQDVCPNCYRTFLLCMLFIRNVCATSYIKHAPSKTLNKNVVLMAAVLTWWENIFVGCTVTPTFFLVDFLIVSITTKNKLKNPVRGKFSLFHVYYSHGVELVQYFAKVMRA